MLRFTSVRASSLVSKLARQECAFPRSLIQPRSQLLTTPMRHRSCTIIGNDAAGKSTLFASLTGAVPSTVPSEKFKNQHDHAPLPDTLLEQAQKAEGSKKICYAQFPILDMAAPIEATISPADSEALRSTDMLMIVLRCFDIEDSPADPVNDLTSIELTLVMSDLAIVDRRMENAQRKTKLLANTRQMTILHQTQSILNEGLMLNSYAHWTPDDLNELQRAELVSHKPILLVCNVGKPNAANPNACKHFKAVQAHLAEQSRIAAAQVQPEPLIEPADAEPLPAMSVKPVVPNVVAVCAETKLETLKAIPRQDQQAQIQFVTQDEQLSQIMSSVRESSGVTSFFTVGPKEAHAWLIRQNSSASDAARAIHSSFGDKFKDAKVISIQDFIANGGEENCFEKKLFKLVAADHIVQHGDVLNIRTS